jgi:hypothetical protein
VPEIDSTLHRIMVYGAPSLGHIIIKVYQKESLLGL